MASRQCKFHGRVEGAAGLCAIPGCGNRGEYKAPLQPPNFNGPGIWRLLCLDHVREHNSAYNYFAGMSAEEIAAAQTPFGGWDQPGRSFATLGSDPPPAWADFVDPLEAISGRFRSVRREQATTSRFTGEERRALAILGLGEDADLHSVRARYSQLVRRFHPDRNGGDRSQEARLSAVIQAWQLLKASPAFA